jgi:hypothetical protein
MRPLASALSFLREEIRKEAEDADVVRLVRRLFLCKAALTSAIPQKASNQMLDVDPEDGTLVAKLGDT